MASSMNEMMGRSIDPFLGRDSSQTSGLNEMEADILHSSHSHSSIDLHEYMDTRPDEELLFSSSSSVTIRVGGGGGEPLLINAERRHKQSVKDDDIQTIHQKPMKFKDVLKYMEHCIAQSSLKLANSCYHTNLSERYDEVFKSELKLQDKEMAKAVKKIVEKRKEQEEVIAVRNENIQVKNQLNEMNAKLAKLRGETNAEMKEATKNLAVVTQQMKESNEKLLEFEKVKKKSIKNYNIVKGLLQKTEEKIGQFTKWCENHGIKVVIIDDIANPRVSDPASASSSVAQKTVVLIQLQNVIPEKPNESFGIEFYYISFEDKNFRVKTVYPTFDTADALLNKVNETLDFNLFVSECKAKWRECFNSSRKSTEEEPKSIPNPSATSPLDSAPIVLNSKVTTTPNLGDKSVALFESPPKDDILYEPMDIS